MAKLFAVLSYPNSNNLGDFIQSLAARQILGKSEIVELDRDQLHNYQKSPVFLIMNGWFMELPTNWPPSEKVSPLFLSFHLNPTAKEKMLNHHGLKYLKKHEPIGCRDYYTKRLLSSFGIKTYYSACLTLCLSRIQYVDKNTKRDGIYVISPMERLNPEISIKDKSFMNSIKQTLKKPLKNYKYQKAIKRLDRFLEKQNENIYYSSQLSDPKKYSENERNFQAKEQLKKIAKAKLVITSRLHTALPAVAFGTPVIFLSDGLEHINQKSRLDGMEKFFPILNTKELDKWYTEYPTPKNEHLTYVKSFEKKIKSFRKI